MESAASSPPPYQVTTAPLEETDLPAAERILRIAFGTFLGAPQPETFWSDRDYVYGRWRAPHVGAIGAKHQDRLVGSGFVTRWGSFAFCGPLTVDVDHQGQDVGQALLAARMALLEQWGIQAAGLFTFADSAKHLALYQKFGFHARFLTAIMTKPIPSAGTVAADWSRYGTLDEAGRLNALNACRQVADTLYPGLDLTEEIETVNDQGLGDTILLQDATGIAAFAVCHYGPRSEAGADTCLVKFAAVRDTSSAPRTYRLLLDACEALTHQVGMAQLLAGVNLVHQEAYQQLVARGYRTMIQGVFMHRHNNPGYCRPGVFVLGDWR